VRTYDSFVELHGWQDQVGAIREAFRSGRPDTIADHVTDDMLWAVAICGDSAQAGEMLKTRSRLPDTAFMAPPSFLVGRRRRSAYDAAAIRFARQLG
jgi:5,10-methylenetetrahydromethanopterin reductase